MEDAHAAVLNLDGSDEPNAFFAVYDGHGGGTVAKFAGQHLHKRLTTEDAYREKRFNEALKKAFLGIDEDLLADPSHTRDPSGCTAVAALVTSDQKVYVANAGDSRAVMSVRGEAKALSFDHKPSNDTERARIVSAGGYIEFGRVNGNLALSRALGDFQFKKNYSLIPQKQVITADPDVTVHAMTDEDEFLVLACDGIWDCLSSQQVVDFIRLRVSEGKDLVEIGEMICEHCLAPDTSSAAGIGCDNMTILIVAILNGRTKEEWYTWMTDRVRNLHGFPTPDHVPQIYSTSRLMAFKTRREAAAERERLRRDRGEDPHTFFSNFPLRQFAEAIGTTKVMFGTEEDDDSGDEASGDDSPNGRPYYSHAFGGADPTAALKSQIAAFQTEDDNDHGESSHGAVARLLVIDEENIVQLEESIDDDFGPASSPTRTRQGEAPPPPKPWVNGDVTPVPQLKSEPRGDQPDPVNKLEGLMDVSEDPLKT